LTPLRCPACTASSTTAAANPTASDVGHQDGIDYLVMEYIEGEGSGADFGGEADDPAGSGPCDPAVFGEGPGRSVANGAGFGERIEMGCADGIEWRSAGADGGTRALEGVDS